MAMKVHQFLYKKQLFQYKPFNDFFVLFQPYCRWMSDEEKNACPKGSQLINIIIFQCSFSSLWSYSNIFIIGMITVGNFLVYCLNIRSFFIILLVVCWFPEKVYFCIINQKYLWKRLWIISDQIWYN